MEKSILRKFSILFIFLTLSLSLLPTQSRAQKLGLGLTYGDRIQNIGGRLDAQFRFHKFFRVSGDVTVFMPTQFDHRAGTWNWWEINSSLHLIFLTMGDFEYYALGGLNYANLLQRFPDSGTTFMHYGIGANAGGGIEKKLDIGTAYLELRHSFNSKRFEQTTLNAGFRFYIGGK